MKAILNFSIPLFTIDSSYKVLPLLINIVSRYTIRPIRLPETPTLLPKDVTVVIPTICEDLHLPLLLRTLIGASETGPARIILVTPNDRISAISQLTSNCEIKVEIEVIGSSVRNKRKQVAQGLKLVQTQVVILADDDVDYPSGNKFLPSILAGFSLPNTGAVGTLQRVERTCWKMQFS